MADLQDMCEELQGMQATMTEQAEHSSRQVRCVDRWYAAGVHLSGASPEIRELSEAVSLGVLVSTAGIRGWQSWKHVPRHAAFMARWFSRYWAVNIGDRGGGQLAARGSYEQRASDSLTLICGSWACRPRRCRSS